MQKCSVNKEFWCCKEALTRLNVEKTFPTAAQKPCHQPLSARIFSSGECLNCSHTLHTQPNQILRSYFAKRPLWYSELTQPCVLWLSERGSTFPLAVHPTMAAHRRELHLWNGGRFIPFKSNLKATEALHTNFLHKYQIGKHCQHQKNPHHKMIPIGITEFLPHELCSILHY